MMVVMAQIELTDCLRIKVNSPAFICNSVRPVFCGEVYPTVCVMRPHIILQHGAQTLPQYEAPF